jgi:co-chaperonin GroES (HSP10)
MQNPGFRPGGKRYLILPDEIQGETASAAGLTISADPDQHKKGTTGTIVARGTAATEYELGAKAVYGEYSGYEQIVNGTKYFILAEAEILGELLPVITFAPGAQLGAEIVVALQGEIPDGLLEAAMSVTQPEAHFLSERAMVRDVVLAVLSWLRAPAVAPSIELTEQQRQEIIESNEPYGVLTRKYGVSAQLIENIRMAEWMQCSLSLDRT